VPDIAKPHFVSSVVADGRLDRRALGAVSTGASCTLGSAS
jgi:hypothetical protein